MQLLSLEKKHQSKIGELHFEIAEIYSQQNKNKEALSAKKEAVKLGAFKDSPLKHGIFLSKCAIDTAKLGEN